MGLEIELSNLCEELNLPEEDKEFVGFIENLSNAKTTEELGLPALGDLRDSLSMPEQRVVDAIVPFNRESVMPQRREVKRNLEKNVPYSCFTKLADKEIIGNPKISLLVRLYAQLKLIGKNFYIWLPPLLKKSLKLDIKDHVIGPGGYRCPINKYFHTPDSSSVPRVYFVNAIDFDGVPFPKRVLPLPKSVSPSPEKITFYHAYSRIREPNSNYSFLSLIRYRIL